MMKALVLVLGLFAGAYANAACEALPTTPETGECTSIATKAECEAWGGCYWDDGHFMTNGAQMTPAQTKIEQMIHAMHHHGKGAPWCDPKGAHCYPEDSWTCCSKICNGTLCD